MEGCFYLPVHTSQASAGIEIEKAYTQGAEGAFVTAATMESNPHLNRFPNLIAVSHPVSTYLALAQHTRKQYTGRLILILGQQEEVVLLQEMFVQLLTPILESPLQHFPITQPMVPNIARNLLNIQPEASLLFLQGPWWHHASDPHASEIWQALSPNIVLLLKAGLIEPHQTVDAFLKFIKPLFQSMDPETDLGIINADDALLVETVMRVWDGRLESFSLHEVEEIHTPAEGGIVFHYESLVFTLDRFGGDGVIHTLACLKTCEALGIPLRKIAKASSHAIS